MHKATAMVQSVVLALLLIGGAHAGTGKSMPANKAAEVAMACSAKSSKAAKPVMKVNINTADAGAIDEALLNVGPAKAAAIVDDRKQHSAFRGADRLAEGRASASRPPKNRYRIVIGGVGSVAALTAKR